MTQISLNQNSRSCSSPKRIRRMINSLSASFSTASRLFITAMVGTLIGVGLTGCDRTYIANADSEKPGSGSVKTPQKSKASHTTSVAVEKVNLTSPADATKVASDATPEGVCRKFMELLQSGNRISAENLLTRTALTVTTRAGLQLEPMGGPTSIFKVNDVLYATNKQKLAQVECTIVDKVDGESYEMDMAWLVRKHSVGWRISGVMLELQPGKTKDLLSFENDRDVNKIKALAGAEVVDDQSRHAKDQNSVIK